MILDSPHQKRILVYSIKDPVFFLFHVDDRIFMNPKKGGVYKMIADFKSTNLDIEDREDIADYLGLKLFNYKTN